jgi:hypothetical protein
MAKEIGYYDPEERSREKEAARLRDESRLKSGAVSPDELHRENSLIASLDLSKARIVRRKSRPGNHRPR